MDCIFCRIVAGQVPADIIYQDEQIVAFRDINPVAPVHVLVIPRKHIPSLASLSQADFAIIGDMVKVANELARREGIAEKGYRLVMNSGKEGGQLVPHLHMHLLGGRRLGNGLG